MKNQIQKFFLFILLFSVAQSGSAQISPGDLSSPHKFLKGLKNCTTCHETAQGIAPAKCLDCHKILKERIDANLGLHSQPSYSKCVNCHTEHHGQDFNLVHWKEGQENFDHSQTGYPLEGGHSKPLCRDCHTEKNIIDAQRLIAAEMKLDRTFLGLEQRCLSCHVDEHRGQLKQDCLSCHVMADWQPAQSFDHNKAKFRLTGKHINVDCTKCHSSRTAADGKLFTQFTGIRFAECVDCHRDPHESRFGNTCKSCHSTAGWTDIKNSSSFDHSKTRFPLRGQHAGIDCQKCHLPGQPHRGLKFANCIDCHSDFHDGQFRDSSSGMECAVCHTVDGFAPSLFTVSDHQKTAFPLEGGHLAIPCVACHSGQSGAPLQPIHSRYNFKSNRFRFEATTCQSCHEDVHFGEVDAQIRTNEGCGSCHNVKSWHIVEFDHEPTGFLLLGGHTKPACIDCHKLKSDARGPAEFQFSKQRTECQACHEDAHLGQFSTFISIDDRLVKRTDCAACHLIDSWQPGNFDHNRDSRFKLDGAHEKVACGKCHPGSEKDGTPFVVFKPIDVKCQTCHG